MKLKQLEVYYLELAKIKDEPIEKQIQIVLDMAKAFEVEPMDNIVDYITSNMKYIVVYCGNVYDEQTWTNTLEVFKKFNYNIKEYKTGQALGKL